MPIDRRGFLKSASLLATSSSIGSLLWSRQARAAIGDTLTIAYNATPPSWDPNLGAHTVSPTLQTLLRTIYDPVIRQDEDLTFAPGVADQFRWNKDKSGITLRLREGVKWQDGTPMTPDDLAWNLARFGNKSANALAPIWSSIKNIRISGREVSFDVDPFRPTMLGRLAFLCCYLVPQHYLNSVGSEGFEKRPMGSGPYIFEDYERGSYVRLKANPYYWDKPPAFENVVFKFVTDPVSRVAEIERGSSDVTMDIPFEEFDRLKKSTALTCHMSPITDVSVLFFNNESVMADENVRLAAVHAVDKKSIVERLLRGYATPVDTLLAPQYQAYDPSITTPYDPKLARDLLAKSGYSVEKPVEFTIQTTRGYKPKDYETIQAIVEMWRRVGIKAIIEVYEIAKQFELRAQHKLAPAAFYNWGNATADPESSLNSAMLSTSMYSSWKSKDVDERLLPLLNERDDAIRFEGYRKLDRYIADHAYVMPLYQFNQPVVLKSELTFKPHLAGFVLPAAIGRKP
jgi:peptide/nickel transport system substrate-binding protein